ncbi:unnamed protein product [Dracunculus medinensis]|uniref:Homeobox domain-containing protein n=1 Tax=Dracunculus medinensis TaxID=318479 RepID=A0A158Q5M5_DRAME|nr:unnamed protein product [Dracunculus medinensis]
MWEKPEKVRGQRECSPFKCVGCKKGISPTDMVYKFKSDIFYHVNCHRCYQCEKVLSPGEQILVDETSKTVACLVHNTSTKSMLLIELDSPLSLSQFSLDSYGYDYADGKYLKRRGPRTTIKQSQLDILNQIFMSTPKPSKHARAKLALETGLSMRVIQVWFQNRRSKERRLKHLCNYLRHYEQRGLIPPPFSLDQNVSRFFNSSVSSTTSITIKQLLAFPFDETNDGDEEDGDYIM